MNVDISERLKSLVDLVSDGNVSAFAKKSGIKPGTLHNYINGRAPSAESLIYICENMGVNLTWLLTGKGEPFLSKEPDRPPPPPQAPADPDLPALLGMTAAVLQSGTDYAESLAANIKSFYKSVEMERRLAAEPDQGPTGTEDRLERLERMCEEIKARLEIEDIGADVPGLPPPAASAGG